MLRYINRFKMDAFLSQLYCRPVNVETPDVFTFHLTDLRIDSHEAIYSRKIERPKHLPQVELFSTKKYKEKSRNNVVTLFGTSDTGHSVCVFVNDFTPYFDISVQDNWGHDDFDRIVSDLEKTISSRLNRGTSSDRRIKIRTSVYSGPRIFGYVPKQDGQPLVSRWLRLKFESMDILRMAKYVFDKKADRRALYEKLFPESSYHKRVFEPAGHHSPVEQMFLTLTDLVPSGWVTVQRHGKAPGTKLSTCQWEVTSTVSALKPNSRTDIAPCVSVSFDIECVPERTKNMPQVYRPLDFVVQIGVSVEVFNGKTIHGVICLGETAPVEDVAIISCSTEVELMNVFQQLISSPRIDPDMVTGYNIFKFDFFYMSERILRYELFSEASIDTLEQLWQKGKQYEKAVGSFRNRDAKVSALQDAWPSYTPPWHEKREIRIPDAMQLLLDSAETIDELKLAKAHFGKKNTPSTFWWCSRLKFERCELRRVILESSAMGQNELFRFDMSGRCVFDLYLHCKNNYKMGSYSLNNVAKKFVNDQKIDLPYEEMFRLYKTDNPKDKATVAKYCSVDCHLVLRIIRNAGIFTDNIEHSRVTYTLLTWLVTRGQQCRVYSQIGRFCERRKVALNHRFVNPPETYTGATVIEPVKGYYQHPIATLDFASLYPSIMQAHNLCFSTLVFPEDRKIVKQLEDKGLIVVERIIASGEEFWFVQEKTYKGTLPSLLHDLLTARRAVKKIMKGEKDAFKKQMLNSKQLALKISCNSVYGFTGSRTGKMGCWPIAACTTTIGRQMIDDTKAAVESQYDAKVVYGDTDSVMVKFNVATPTEEGMKLSWKLAEEAADYVTNVTFGAHPAVELEAEKVYWPYLIFDRKKRYIGRTYMHPDNPPKIDCKGVELVRRDNSQFLRDIYQKTVDRMMPPTGLALTKGEVLLAIRKEVDDALNHLIANEVPMEKFVVTKSLKKTYKNPNLPHVVLAEKIRQRILDGEMMTDPPKAGDRISYVIVQTKNTKDKLCDKTEDLKWVNDHPKIKIDREYYVTNQIMKPFNQIVKPFGSLDDLWQSSLAELKRQRLKIKSLTQYFLPSTVKTDPIQPSMMVTSYCQPPPAKKKKKKKKRQQTSLFDFANK
jgi:DNA polymerase elongation subunit (family B)